MVRVLSSRSVVRVCVPVLLLGWLGVPQLARANGQSTHLWISEHALSHLPAGPLRDLLEAQRQMLENGTMFPDGGYPLGEPYAELAHWEPFQGAYMDEIRASFDPPYQGEGAEHLAFLLGMNSHGLADTVFDGLYMERTIAYDGEADELDATSDIVMMSLVPPRVAPEDWAPYELFVELFASTHDTVVDPERMRQGQSLLRVAVTAVASAAQDPEILQDAIDRYPWGNAHLDDDTVPGAPPCEGEIIARYWQSQWELLQGRELYRPVLATVPDDGSAFHERDASSLESELAFVFARGLASDSVVADAFSLHDEDGAEIALELHHFRGESSHLVLLFPQSDLAPDTHYVAAVAPGLQTIHGESLAGWSFAFSTGADAPDPQQAPWGEGLDGSEATGESGESEDTAAGTGEGGCACAVGAPEAARVSGWALLALLALPSRRSSRLRHRFAALLAREPPTP